MKRKVKYAILAGILWNDFESLMVKWSRPDFFLSCLPKVTERRHQGISQLGSHSRAPLCFCTERRGDPGPRGSRCRDRKACLLSSVAHAHKT